MNVVNSVSAHVDVSPHVSAHFWHNKYRFSIKVHVGPRIPGYDFITWIMRFQNCPTVLILNVLQQGARTNSCGEKEERKKEKWNHCGEFRAGSKFAELNPAESWGAHRVYRQPGTAVTGDLLEVMGSGQVLPLTQCSSVSVPSLLSLHTDLSCTCIVLVGEHIDHSQAISQVW